MRKAHPYQFILAASVIALASPAVAGGFNSSGTSKQINVVGGTSTLKVKHSDAAFAGAYVGPNGSGAVGGGTSKTVTKSKTTAITQKKSVSNGSSSANNKNAKANGATFTAVKVQAADGSYFLYKGSASAHAKAGQGGASSGGASSFKSASGKK